MSDSNQIKDFYITTKNNPFDPWEDFFNWNQWDIHHLGYNTSSEIAKEAIYIEGMSDEWNIRQRQLAMDRIIANNPKGIEYIKVPKPD